LNIETNIVKKEYIEALISPLSSSFVSESGSYSRPYFGTQCNDNDGIDSSDDIDDDIDDIDDDTDDEEKKEVYNIYIYIYIYKYIYIYIYI
jgi:hypothetical protein